MKLLLVLVALALLLRRFMRSQDRLDEEGRPCDARLPRLHVTTNGVGCA